VTQRIRQEQFSSATPTVIDTCSHYASMRQIHAAIDHWRHADFECAITLAGAAEGMLPDIDEPHYRALQNFTRANENPTG
jgi:hypothetical protein